jgi:cytochrome c2
MPDLPYDQGRRQSLGPEPLQYHWKESRFASELRLFQHNEGRADFVWDKEKLDRFIAKPDEVVPGNNMKPYGGLTSGGDRARVIVFLESPTTN